MLLFQERSRSQLPIQLVRHAIQNGGDGGDKTQLYLLDKYDKAIGLENEAE